MALWPVGPAGTATSQAGLLWHVPILTRGLSDRLGVGACAHWGVLRLTGSCRVDWRSGPSRA
eukprot:12866475-Alexandrium_andersonii.AAC.1